MAAEAENRRLRTIDRLALLSLTQRPYVTLILSRRALQVSMETNVVQGCNSS